MSTSTNAYSYKEHVRIGYYHQSYGWISPPVATAGDIENIQQEINNYFDVTNPLEKNTIKINKIEKKDCCEEGCVGCDPADPATCCCIDIMGESCLEWSPPELNDLDDDGEPDDPQKKKTKINKEKVETPAVETEEITTETIEADNPVFDGPNAGCTKTKCQQNKENIQTDTINVGLPATGTGGAGGSAPPPGGAGAMSPAVFVGASATVGGAGGAGGATGIVSLGPIATSSAQGILTDVIKENMPDVGVLVEEVLLKDGVVYTNSVPASISGGLTVSPITSNYRTSGAFVVLQIPAFTHMMTTADPLLIISGINSSTMVKMNGTIMLWFESHCEECMYIFEDDTISIMRKTYSDFPIGNIEHGHDFSGHQFLVSIPYMKVIPLI